MKHQIPHNSPSPLTSVDGPPIDLAFKSIRSLQQLLENMPITKTKTMPTDAKDKIKTGNTTANIGELHAGTGGKVSQTVKKLGDSKDGDVSGADGMLQIVRTIETTDHNYMETQQKKTVAEKEKVEKKMKRVVTPQTTALFLGYNKLANIDNFMEMIQPIFPLMHANLMWVDLCHNRLVELSPDLGQLKNLKTLYLHANYLSNFGELDKVKGAEQLRTLTIHANPLQAFEEFRVIVHSILPRLKKIDSTLVTKRETERSSVLMKSMKKYPVIKNPKKPPEQSENEEQDNA